VSKQGLPGLAILAAVFFASATMAFEPDGRVAFRYEWLAAADDAAAAPKLRLSVTAFVPLSETRLQATLPRGVAVVVQAAGRAPAPWPEEGLAIGGLAAGQTMVLELDVAKPADGGGIVEFVIDATAGGDAFRERVGVPVGLPGTAPTLRNGAVEFPASQEVPAP
jgi:hypothetical protein